MLVRIVLVLGGLLATLFVARDAPNFPVVQAMLGILAVVALLLAFTLLRRR